MNTSTHRLIDWILHDTSANYATLPNPNDEESVRIVIVQGDVLGRRVGHTATLLKIVYLRQFVRE